MVDDIKNKLDALNNSFVNAKDNAGQSSKPDNSYGDYGLKTGVDGVKAGKGYADSLYNLATDKDVAATSNYTMRSRIGGVGLSGISAMEGVDKKNKAQERLSRGDVDNQYADDNDFTNKANLDISKGDLSVKGLGYSSLKVSETMYERYKKSKEMYKTISITANTAKGAKIAMVGKAASVAHGLKITFDIYEWIYHELLHQPSPIDTYIIKPFAGDWDAMSDAMTTWANLAEQISEAAIMMIEDLEKLDENDWLGKTATAFYNEQARILDSLSPLPQSCIYINKALEAAADFSQNILDYIAEGILTVIEGIVSVASLFTSVIGIPAAIVKCAGLIMDILTIYNNITQLFNDYQTALHNLQAVVTSAQQSSDNLKSLNSSLGV